MMAEQAAIVGDLAESVRALRPDDIVDMDIALAAAIYVELVDVQKELGAVMSLLTHAFAESLPYKETTVEGIGTIRRRGKKDRTRWDKDDLLRAVLDSRLVDKTTGFISEESPLDKVLAVWNLGPPRTKVLENRGIDPDEFCHSEWGGWTIEVIR